MQIFRMLILSILFFGCATGRLTKDRENGGRVSVSAWQANSEQVLKAASPEMNKKCPKGFKIIEKGEEVVGQTCSGAYNSICTNTVSPYIDFECIK